MYNLLNKKSIFIFLTFIIIIFLWLLIDLLYSRLIYKEVSYGCFNYNTTASFYDLKPNCFSKEKIVKTTNAYNVFTDENGYRYSGEKKNKKLLSNEVGTEASIIAKNKKIRKLVHSFQIDLAYNPPKNTKDHALMGGILLTILCLMLTLSFL